MADHYLHDTSAEPLEPGVRRWVANERWNTPLGKPNGGYVLATMMRAVSDELGLERPIVAAITYLASPEPGEEAIITIEPVKLGRRVQTVRARLAHPASGRDWADLTISFAGDHSGPDHELGRPPALPAPAECLDPRDHGFDRPGLFEQLELRFAQAPGWAAGTPSGDPTLEVWQRLAHGRDVDFPALGLLADTLPPPVLELGSHLSMTVQLTVHFHRLPEPDSWVASRFITRHVANGFHEEDGELWDESGHLLAQSRQLAILL